MNFVLLADLEKLIVPFIVIVIYVVASFVKYAGDKKPAPRRPAAPPPLPVPRRAESPRDMMRMEPASAGRSDQPPDARVELDRFLEELGVRNPKGQQRPTAQAKPNRRERGRGKQSQPQPKPASSERASKRHLTSQLEQRRTDDSHSDIETQHIHTHVHAVESNIGASSEAPVRSRPTGDAVLMSLVRNRETLARAMILGMVLGPPNALRDENRLA